MVYVFLSYSILERESVNSLFKIGKDLILSDLNNLTPAGKVTN